MNQPEAYIFIGRSGSGKGTQAKLLLDKLKQANIPTLYIETGARFRDFINGDFYASRLAFKLMEQFASQPSFLAVKMWADILVKDFSGVETVIFDGTPRSLIEAQALDTAFLFFGFVKRSVIHLAVSKESSALHLKARGRLDDTPAGIIQRLNWFETDVVPTLNYYRTNKNYKFIEIDGEQSIEAVHSTICQEL